MRFLELRPDGVGPSFGLDPRLTLLRGLDPADRVALVGFVHSVAAGETFDWEGTVEVHGVQMTLTDMLDLVGPTADAAAIVEATTLAAPRSDERVRPEQLALTEAQARRAELETEVSDLAEELGAAGGLRRDMKARLAAADGAVDRRAGASLDRADGELSRAARALGRLDPWTGTSAPQERIQALDAMIVELDRQLASLPSGDRAELASAAATCRLVLADGPVPDPEAVALAEAWLSLHQRLEGLESRVESTGGGTEAVAARLDAARAAARAAEDAAVPRSISEDEVAQLESLHERVVALEGKTGRAMRRGAAKRGFEEAQADLISALDAVGYPSWAAFRMGNGMAPVRPDLLHEYETAQADLVAAEMEWAELMTRLEQDADLQSVLNAIEAALEHGVHLLGQDPYQLGDSDDPEILADALRARTIDARSVHVDRELSFARLHAALQASGAAGLDGLRGELGLIGLAETWLRVLAAADSAAVRALRDRERASAEIHELRAMDSDRGTDGLERERNEVLQAEEAVGTLRARLFEVTGIQLELHMLAATELGLAEQHDAKAGQLEAAIETERHAGATALAVNAPAAGIADVAARIPRGDAGPVPLVVLMGDAPADVLDAVVGLPADVQIIVVGGDAATEAVVTRLGGSCTKGAEGPAFA